MKIMINYDLIDKVREAKIGFSLQKYVRTVGFTYAVSTPIILLIVGLSNISNVETFKLLLDPFGYSIFYSSIYSFIFSFFYKGVATNELIELSRKLNHIYVETDVELLKQSYKYDSEYSINFDSFPPKIEQKKYIMVPVNNNWGRNERSLVQEHVIGTKEYVLSSGQPEKKKVYSYKRSRVFNA